MIRCSLVFLLMIGLQGSVMADLFMVSAVNSPWKSVSKEDLRDLYIGKTKSLQRVPCVPLILVTDPDYSYFIREIVRKTPQSFERNWKKLLFSGKATLPMRCNSLDEIYQLLRENDQRVSFSLTEDKVDGISFVLVK